MDRRSVLQGRLLCARARQSSDLARLLHTQHNLGIDCELDSQADLAVDFVCGPEAAVVVVDACEVVEAGADLKEQARLGAALERRLTAVASFRRRLVLLEQTAATVPFLLELQAHICMNYSLPMMVASCPGELAHMVVAMHDQAHAKKNPLVLPRDARPQPSVQARAVLQQVPGIGPKKLAPLLQETPTLLGVATAASLQPALPAAAATKAYNFLHNPLF